SENGYALIYKDIKYNTSPRKMELAFLSKIFSKDEIDNLNKKLDLYDLDNTELKIRQETQDIKEEILNELSKQNKVISDKDILINNLQKELKEFKTDYETIISEIEILFPDLGEVSIGRH